MKDCIYYLMIPIATFLLSGCDIKDSNISACDSRIPLYSSFVGDHAFSSLQYYKHENEKQMMHDGYDLWTDSKFQFNSGLQFGFLNKEENEKKLTCINSVVLRLVMPLQDKQMMMLNAFIEKIAGSANVNSVKIYQMVNNVRLKEQSFRLIVDQNMLLIKAGILHHPYRGDFLVVAMETKK